MPQMPFEPALEELDLALRFFFGLQLVLDDGISELGQAVDAQLGMASVCSASSLNRAMIFFAASALPLGGADDLEDRVERVEDGRETFEDVHPLRELFELVFESLRDDVEAEVEEVPEHGAEIRGAGAADVGFSVGTRHVRFTAKFVWSGVFFEEVREHLLLVGLLLQLELDANVVRRDVLHVEEERHLPLHDDVGDALDEHRLVHGVRDARDEERLRSAALGALLPRRADLPRCPGPSRRSA